MANASWIYAALAGFVVGILCVTVPDTFLDDLSERFLWTKAGYYWTKARLGLNRWRLRPRKSARSRGASWPAFSNKGSRREQTRYRMRPHYAVGESVSCRTPRLGQSS